MGMLEQMFNFAQQVIHGRAGKKKKREFRATPGGRPANVLPNGRVVRIPAIVQFNAVPHITREGQPVFAREKAIKGGGVYQVMCHRAVDRRELKKAIYQAERAKRGRYVGPFGAPTKAARA